MKVSLEEKLESETSRYAATEKHNIQLKNLVQQLKDEAVNFEMKLKLQKGKLVMPDQILLLEWVLTLSYTNPVCGTKDSLCYYQHVRVMRKYGNVHTFGTLQKQLQI